MNGIQTCRNIVVASLALMALAIGNAQGDEVVTLQMTASSQQSAAAASGKFLHTRPAVLSSVRAKALEIRSTAAAGTATPAGPSGNRYPADLSYGGGAIVTTMSSHTIFVNPTAACPPNSCFGDPITFLGDLGRSAFMHIIDQYTGSRAPNRYGVGTNYAYYSGLPAVLTDADMVNVVTAAVEFSGQFGYGHEYHVFLAPGQDECFDSSYTVCYSPDNRPSFYFCAYHGSFDLPGYGHVLYSVEPYQAVPGCQDTGAIPNGTLADSTNNTLSHELFETITDPDGTGWTNSTDNGLAGEEIGDECSFINATGFDPSVWHVGGKTYATQPEYSNQAHTCNTNGEN